jgi:hypothetical protein
MVWNIKNDEADRLAGELAAVTGETSTPGGIIGYDAGRPR